MKKIKFNATWLLIAAIPFQIAAIILFGASKSVIGGVLLAVGSVLYLVGILLSRKERKAENTALEAVTEQAEATETEAAEENA
jgi:hypothetical protein